MLFYVKSIYYFLTVLRIHAAAFLIDPVSNNQLISMKDKLRNAALSRNNDDTAGAIVRGDRAAAQDQIRLAITGDSQYPETLTYTEQHIWFGPDKNASKTRIGTTTYLISHLLGNDIDGAAFPLDHNDAVIPGQLLGKLFGSNENDFDIQAPFAAVFETANLDMNLNSMVDDPYNDDGFLALLIGNPPHTAPSPIKFMNGSEYAKFVNNLE